MKDLAGNIRDFVESDVRAWTSDHENVPRYPEGLVDRMTDLGLFGLGVPAEFGGIPVASRELFGAVRELAKGFVPLTGMLGSHLKACQYLAHFGTQSQKEHMLPKMAKGSMIAAHAYTEENGKSAGTIQTHLHIVDGIVALRGHKVCITNAAHADLIAVVAAYHRGTHKQNKKIGIVLLPSDERGLHIGADIPRLGMEGISLCNADFECQITEKHVLGGLEFDAREALAQVQADTLMHYSARAVGLAEAIVDETAGFVAKKMSGDRVFIEIPTVKGKIDRMRYLLAEEEVSLDKLIFMREKGGDLIKDAYRVKACTTEATFEIARLGVSLHGGAGYTKQHQVERHLREAVGLTLIGTPTDVALARATALQ